MVGLIPNGPVMVWGNEFSFSELSDPDADDTSKILYTGAFYLPENVVSLSQLVLIPSLCNGTKVTQTLPFPSGL